MNPDVIAVRGLMMGLLFSLPLWAIIIALVKGVVLM